MLRRALAIVTLVVVPLPALAAWDSFPILPPGEHVAVKPVLDDKSWEQARDCFREPKSAVDAAYFAGVVGVTDALGRTDLAPDAVPYVDALYQAWKPLGRLDPDRHVLVAVGLNNRAIAIHPGSRFAELGFKGSVIKTTIDGSDFPRFAKSGDYARALCALRGAVDVKLKALVEEEAASIAAARQELDKLRTRRDALYNTLGALSAPWASTRIASLRQHDEQFDEAARRLMDGRLASARETIASIATHVTSAEDALAGYQRLVRSVAEAQERYASIEPVLRRHPLWDHPRTALARAHLAECKTRIDAVAGSVSTWQSWLPTPAVDGACAQRVLDVDLPAAVEEHRYRTRTVPLAVGLLAGISAFLLIAFRRRQRATARAYARVELESWKTKLENASARLLQLERDHALYLSASRPRWTGESAALDQRAADGVNRAFLLLSAASDLHKDAEVSAAGAGPLAVRPFTDVVAKLSTTSVVFETGDVEKRRKVFLPLSERYEGTAAQLLDDLSKAYETAAASLDAASGAMDRAAAVGGECAIGAERALDEAKIRGELGYPTARYAEALDPLLAERREAERAVITDPLGAEARLRAAKGSIESIATRLRRGNDTARALQEAAQTGRALRETIARLQGEGLRLDEPELTPVARLDRSATRGAEVRRSIADGEEGAAEATLAIVARTLQDLARDLEHTEAARRDVPAACVAVRAKVASVRERLPDSRAALLRLEERHAASAFADEAAALRTVNEILAASERAIARAFLDHGDQRYLGGREAVGHAEAAAERAQALVLAILQIEARLDAAKIETTSVLAKNEAAIAALGDVLTRGVSTALADRTRALIVAARETAERAKDDRPHWLAISRDATVAAQRLHAIDAELRAEIQAWILADGAAREIELALEDLQHAVERETRDREHVAEAVRIALTEIGSVRVRVARREESGHALVEAVRQARMKADWAQEVWRAELDEITTAERELDNARRAIGRVSQRMYGEGVAPNMSRVTSQLSEAEAAADARDWKRAMIAAEGARSLADSEERLCEERVRRAERERLDALAAASSSSNRWSTNTSSSSSSMSSAIFGAVADVAISSVFSSSSSDSSSSSGSGGSSFGSSDSGGSSFGSSDSGGSSW